MNRFDTLLKHVKYKEFGFKVGSDGERFFLQVYNMDLCAKSNQIELQKGRKWFLSPYMTDSEVITTAFKAIMTFEEHETRENFRYKGKAIFGPHINVEALHSICDELEAREVQA